MLVNLTEYHRPATLGEALELLRQGQELVAVLAGGTELVAENRHSLRAVIDLGALGLAGIHEGDGQVSIGAMTTLKALSTSPTLQTLASGLLSRAAYQSAPATIRRAATLGGTLAGTKGGYEVPTALLALGARVTLATPEPVSIPLADFLARRAELLEGFIMTEITVPLTAGAWGGLARVSRSPADRAILFAAAVVTGERTRLALGGLTAHPQLLPIDIHPEEVDTHLAGWDRVGDFRASAEYRTWVAPILVRRALEDALGGKTL